MKIGDVKYLNRDQGVYSEIKNPSPVTLSLATLLLNDQRFTQEINNLREDYAKNAPYPYNILNDRSNGHLDLFLLIKDELKGLTNQYNLPQEYVFRFFVFMLCNAFINITDEDKEDFIYLSDASDISHYIRAIEEDEDRTGAIMIGSRCTKEELIEWLDKNWMDIEKDMKDTLPEYPKGGKLYKNITVAQEIQELHADGKTYEEISDILCKKYPEKDCVYDSSWIKTTLSRHLKRSKKFISNNPDLDDWDD